MYACMYMWLCVCHFSQGSCGMRPTVFISVANIFTSPISGQPLSWPTDHTAAESCCPCCCCRCSQGLLVLLAIFSILMYGYIYIYIYGPSRWLLKINKSAKLSSCLLFASFLFAFWFSLSFCQRASCATYLRTKVKKPKAIKFSIVSLPLYAMRFSLFLFFIPFFSLIH